MLRVLVTGLVSCCLNTFDADGCLIVMVDVVCVIVCWIAVLIVLLFVHYTFAYSLSLLGDFVLWWIGYALWFDCVFCVGAVCLIA